MGVKCAGINTAGWGGVGWCGGGGQKFYESGTGGAAGSGAVLVPILGSLFK